MVRQETKIRINRTDLTYTHQAFGRVKWKKEGEKKQICTKPAGSGYV